MKIKKSMLLLLIIFPLSMLSCKNSISGEWVAKIGGDTISLNKLNTFYYAQQKSIYNQSREEIDILAADPDSVEKNPTLNKVEFLENLIRQRLVYNKAIDEGTLKKEEVAALVQMAEEAVVVGYYVKEKFKDEIAVSEEEVSKFYTQQKSKFRGVPIEQAEQYIRQQLFQQRLQMKLRDFVENLKEQSIIEKNISLLTKESQKNIQEKEESKEGDKK